MRKKITQYTKYRNKLISKISSLKRKGLDVLIDTPLTEKQLRQKGVKGKELTNLTNAIKKTLKNFKKKCKREIENLTAMNIETIDIVAKGIYIPEE